MGKNDALVQCALSLGLECLSADFVRDPALFVSAVAAVSLRAFRAISIITANILIVKKYILFERSYCQMCIT